MPTRRHHLPPLPPPCASERPAALSPLQAQRFTRREASLRGAVLNARPRLIHADFGVHTRPVMWRRGRTQVGVIDSPHHRRGFQDICPDHLASLLIAS